MIVKVAISAPARAIAISSRHRPEYLALDALHREQGNERRYGNRRGEKNGLIDLQPAYEDEAKPLAPSPAASVRRTCWVRPPMSLDEIVQEAPPLRLFRLEISKNILDQDYRRIDDDPEVDRAQRQEVRILAPDYEEDNGYEEEGDEGEDSKEEEEEEGEESELGIAQRQGCHFV